MTLHRKYQHLQLLSEGKDEDVVQSGSLRKLKVFVKLFITSSGEVSLRRLFSLETDSFLGVYLLPRTCRGRGYR